MSQTRDAEASQSDVTGDSQIRIGQMVSHLLRLHLRGSSHNVAKMSDVDLSLAAGCVR